MKDVSYNDVVYGQIRLDPLQQEILKLPELQRLGYVNQLGLKNMVYRGATHKRIEHSIGVGYMASNMAKKLGLGPNEVALVTVAGSLHDTGHFPCSHTMESIMPMNHMECLDTVFSGKSFPDREEKTISELLESNGFNPKDVIALINGWFRSENGQDYLQEIIHGPIDADQMDFLQRDAIHTGNSSGLIRLSRLLEVLTLNNQHLAVVEKGISEAEHFYYARKKMYEDVYLHPVGKICETMLSKAARPVIDSFTIEQMTSYRDEQFFYELAKKGDYQQEMINRLFNRNLFKTAYNIKSHESELFENVLELSKKGIDLIEKEISGISGVDPNYIIVNFPLEVLKITEPRINPNNDIDVLLKNNQVKKLTDLRKTAKAILEEPPTSEIFAVYAPKEFIEDVSEAARQQVN